MKPRLLSKKVPTGLGLLLIIVGLVATTILVKNGGSFQINAGPGQDPKNIAITNTIDSSFTVTYTTDDQVVGTLNYGTSKDALDKVVLDDRDQLSQTINDYKVHSITVKNLEPETEYYFSITSGDKKYMDNNSAFNAKTGSIINKDPSSQIPISGKVITPDGSSPGEGIVYVSINGAQKLSAFLKNDGNYTIPLNNLRTDSIDEYFIIVASSIINIEVGSGNLISSVSVSKDQINPVPIITLSNSYDFSTSDAASDSAEFREDVGFPSVDTISQTGEPKILTPDTGEEFTDSKPNFEGVAQPNQAVEIVIHSTENIKAQVLAGKDGKWKYRPQNPLSPGDHTITITTKNNQGILKTITKKFVVFAEGSQVNQSATPSATLTPRLTLIPTKTPMPTVIITTTPSESPSISLTPVPTIPPTGNSSVIIAAFAGVAAIGAGIILFLLTRGQGFL